MANMLSEDRYYNFDLQKNWGKQLKEAYTLCQWIKKDIVKELIYNRECDLVIEPSNTGKWYIALFPCGNMFYGVDCRVDPSDSSKFLYFDCLPNRYVKEDDKFKEVFALDMDSVVSMDTGNDPELEALCEWHDKMMEEEMEKKA